MPVRPFMAERIMMRAAVVTAMALMLIQLMILIALFDFFEMRYRFAI
jgi:hypothetical protein